MSLTTKRFLKFFTILLIVQSTFVLAACGAKGGQASEEPTAIPTIEIPTATPLPPDRAVLVASADTNATDLTEMQDAISELTTASGLEFEVWQGQDVSSEMISGDIKIMVFMYHPDNLGSLAANAPGTQFAAVSELNWQPPANVTIIRTKRNDVAFLGGYIAAMLAPNYRCGALLASENVEFNQAFDNGVQYYCGICASSLIPLNTYPVISQQPAASTPETWQAAFDEINLSKINVLFLAPEATSAQLASYLSAQDVTVIGTQSPGSEALSKWAATIYMDTITPVREIWNDLVSGVGGKIINASLKLSDIQPLTVTDGSVWLSPGKEILIDKVIDLLRDDKIYTLSIQ